jgi:hypothetical protein
MDLPFDPRPLEALRARYPAAVARVYNLDDMQNGGPSPAQDGLEGHCFDFEDGVRMMAYRERTEAEPAPITRVLASVHLDTPLGAAVADGSISPPQLNAIFMLHFEKLVGAEADMEFDGHDDGITCFTVREPEGP